MLVPAKMCKTLQYAEKQTQNPPIARSWGFDPPSRHHRINSLELFRYILPSRIALLVSIFLAAFRSLASTTHHKMRPYVHLPVSISSRESQLSTAPLWQISSTKASLTSVPQRI
jgi:hypothetical protein